jgi:hypothetical protein
MAPAATLRDVGAALRVKSDAGGGADEDTTRVKLVEWLRFPLAPITVTVELPPGVEFVVVTVNVETPEALIGEKLPVAPDGKPLSCNDTVP